MAKKKGIDSQKVLYSEGKNDECYTPAYGVRPILKYIPKGKVVWCPFDEEQSEYVKLISENNTVIFTHINQDENFHTYDPKFHWDMMISNPPFTKKRQIFERALSFKKPFALLANMATFNDRNPTFCFEDAGVDMQLLKFDKRILFMDAEGNVNTKITFQTGYLCYNVLPKQIVMEELERE